MQGVDFDGEQFRQRSVGASAAEQIEGDYGTEKALGYLIGEKFLDFLEASETRSEWRAEIPQFVAKIKEIFESWQIAEFFAAPRRLASAWQ